METIPRQQGGRPRHIHFERAEEQSEKNTPIVEEQESVIESDVHPSPWEKRTTEVGSRVKCLSFIKGEEKVVLVIGQFLAAAKAL